MAASVQLPGYNHTAPITGLADIVNTIGNIRQRSQQADLVKSQAENEGLKNEGLKREAAYQGKLSDPNTVESKSALNDLVANAQIHKEVGMKLGLSPQSLQPFDQLINAAKNGVPTNSAPLPDGQIGPQQPTYTPMSGIDAMRAKDSPLFKGIESMYEAKLKGDQNVAAAGIRAAPQMVRNQSQANAQYQSDMKPIESTIQAANRVEGIIAKIKAGGLKSTPTLSMDLSNALGSMFNNGKAATVYGSEGAKLSSLEGDVAKKFGYADGQAVNTVAGPQLDQLGKDVGALRDEYAYAHKAAFDSFVSGLDPSLRPALQKRFDSFRKTSVLTNLNRQEAAAKESGPAVDADLTKMTPEQLTNYIKTHGT